MRIPPPRGPLSTAVAKALRGAPGPSPALVDAVRDGVADVDDAIGDADLQLALALCYELHYRGFEGVDDGWEWEPSMLAARAGLERAFVAALRAAVPVPAPGGDVAADLRALIAADTGPSLSQFMLRHADADQFRELIAERSVYHLKEADPHTWAIPRTSGRTKAALVEIQSDEYGGGDHDRLHQNMFADTMRALGLDGTYGHYWPSARATTFASVNLMSYFGLHRAHLGALLGHLSMVEMTSSVPSRRYVNGLRRLGFGTDATAFYDEHIEADAVHEQLAAVDLCGSFVAGEPARHADLLWGAACGLHVDGRSATDLLTSWDACAAA